MYKKILIPGLLFLVVIVVAVIMIINGNKITSNQNLPEINNPEGQDIVLFYGDGCPHCKIVEEYLNANNISERIKYSTKEVYSNKKNADDLVAKAKICGLPTNSIGVPFLWDGAQCYMGDESIIKFFKSKLVTR